jgi:DNA-binding beta-propeller fold protein YncE
MALFVTSRADNSVKEYDGITGVFVKVAASGGALGEPLGVVIGLDGNLLVSDGQTNQVKRYNRTTGAFIDVFASTNLAGPTGMTIHQGVLYVTNSQPPQGVQRFDATTGANTGQFVPSIAFPTPRDVKVNPANNRLYVLYSSAATVEMFDLTTMASLGPLMPSGSGGLSTPTSMVFGPDGNLYICGGPPYGVRRYNPTGAFIDVFVSGDVPSGITFGPDNNLYVANSYNPSNVPRFNYPTGAFMDFFVNLGSGDLGRSYHLTFDAVTGATLTYTLHRDCLNNVDDPGMRWQIEGGRVLENGQHVADYSSVKRVSCGTTHQNTAQLWVTLFYIGEKPPQNITLHGAHDFDSGGEIGSVSAASSAFSAHIGKQFKRVGNTLTIG